MPPRQRADTREPTMFCSAQLTQSALALFHSPSHPQVHEKAGALVLPRQGCQDNSSRFLDPPLDCG